MEIISFDDLEHLKPTAQELWQRIEALEEAVADLQVQIEKLQHDYHDR